MKEIVIDVGNIEIPRYIEVFDTTMNTKEYFATLHEAAAYMQVAVSKIVDALCEDLEIRIKGRYRVDVITEEEEEEDYPFDRQLDVIFRNYRTNEVVIVGSIKDARLKTGIDERIISKYLDEQRDTVVDGFVFRKAKVNRTKAWPVYDETQLSESSSNYFIELKEFANVFYKRNQAIDQLLKDLLHTHFIEMKTDRDLTVDQRRHYLPLLDKGLAMRYGFDVDTLVKHVKDNVKFIRRELDHILDDDDDNYAGKHVLKTDLDYGM